MSEFLFDLVDDFVEETWRDRNVAKNPRNMFDGGELDRVVVLGIEVSAFSVFPCEGRFLESDEMFDEFNLLRPEEIERIEVERIVTLLSEAWSRSKFWRTRREDRHIAERIRMSASDDAVLLRE